MTAAIAEDILERLNLALNVTANSAAEYVLLSSPYTTDADKATLGAIKEVAASDRELTAELAALISDNDGIPRNGLPDIAFAEWNYLSFPTLLDLLLQKTNRDQAVLKNVRDAVKADARASAVVDKVMAARDAAIKKYGELLASYSKSE